MNLRLGMKAYGIIDNDVYLTGFGNSLYNIRNDIETLYRTLAKHILLNLNGLTLIQCLQDMEAAGEKIDLINLRHWLEERGVSQDEYEEHIRPDRLAELSAIVI